MYHWLGAGQTGCTFAGRIGQKKPKDSDVLPLVVSDLDERTPGVIRAFLDARSSAAYVIFPMIRTAEDIARLVAFLARSDSRWSWSIVKSHVDTEALNIGLKWKLPNGDYVSIAQGLANLPTMPFTRRAPVTAMLLRAREPDSEAAKRNYDEETGLPLVNLGDIRIDWSAEKVKDQIRLTRRLTNLLLNGEFSEPMRTRVTFRLPLSVEPILQGATPSG